MIIFVKNLTTMKTLLLFGAIALSINAFGQVPNYVPTNGLVAWYGLDNDAQDASGNANHGTLTIAPTADFDRNGVADAAYTFDGTQYITLPAINLPEFTINFWLKLDLNGLGTNRAVVSKHYSASTTNSSYIFMSNTTASSIPRVYYTTPTNTPYWTDGTSTLDGCWHMLTGTLNAGALSFYLDGVLISSGTGGISKSNSIPTFIGAYHTNGGVPYPSLMGTLDEVGLWDTALTPAQIQDIYSNSTPVPVIDVQTACDTYTWIDGNTYTASNNTAQWTLANAAGCDSVVTLDLTITPLPDNNVTQSGSLLTADQAGATYQWLDCDDNNAEINGETNQSYTPTVTGNYSVEVTLNGCVDTSACILVDYTGIEEIESLVSVHPNPTKDEVTLSVKADLVGTGFTITDNAGRIVLTDTFKSTEQNVNLSVFDNGVYFIRTDKESQPVKIIKQ